MHDFHQIPSLHEEIWRPRGGNFPNRWFVWASQHPTSHTFALLFGKTYTKAPRMDWTIIGWVLVFKTFEITEKSFSSGPKMADKNERTFTEEQLRAHEGELNLQMGFNKGASQSGHGGEITFKFLKIININFSLLGIFRLWQLSSHVKSTRKRNVSLNYFST